MNTYQKLIKDQIEYGGKKYASSNKEKEVTDILVNRYGMQWLVGTVNKYVFRFKNLQREKDLLKIGAYMYIIWLKWGLHLGSFTNFNRARLYDTNINLKLKHLDKFLEGASAYRNDTIAVDMGEVLPERRLELVDAAVEKVHENYKMGHTYAEDLFHVFCLCEDLYRVHGFKGKDTDTFNEEPDLATVKQREVVTAKRGRGRPPKNAKS